MHLLWNLMFTFNDSECYLRILSILDITNSGKPLSDVYKCKWFETHSAEKNWNGSFGASRAFTSQHSSLCSDTEDSIWSVINVFTPFAIVPISTALYQPCHYPTVQPCMGKAMIHHAINNTPQIKSWQA